MELDVTHMVEDADNMIALSGSRAEHGENASRITWANSMLYGHIYPLLKTDDERDAARAHFKEYGAWTADEIDKWSEDELQGMACQEVAAQIRQMACATDYEDYQRLSEAGIVSGRLHRDDHGKWFCYFGS